MKLKNLVPIYVYEVASIKQYGETTLKWKYKDEMKLNIQQDIGELDVNSAGIIDFEKIKVRMDYDYNLNKSDGISFKKLEIGKDGYAIKAPEYKVISKTKAGRTITCQCEIYHGE